MSVNSFLSLIVAVVMGIVIFWLGLDASNIFTFFDKKETGKVIKIYDGDTMTISSGNRDLKIRLFGIDAPELKQSFGQESKANLLKKCPLESQAEIFSKSIDKYNRVVAIVKCNGYNLNTEQVSDGFAWAYTDYSWIYFPQQIQAKFKKNGLWSEQNPIEPRQWRLKQRNRYD